MIFVVAMAAPPIDLNLLHHLFVHCLWAYLTLEASVVVIVPIALPDFDLLTAVERIKSINMSAFRKIFGFAFFFAHSSKD